MSSEVQGHRIQKDIWQPYDKERLSMESRLVSIISIPRKVLDKKIGNYLRGL